MVKPLDLAAPATANVCFADDLFLDNPFINTSSAASLQQKGFAIHDLFESFADILPDLGPVGGAGAGEELEELEWLSNKDAFPSLEMAFDMPSPASEALSPVSVLCAPAAFSAPVKRPRSKGQRRRRTAMDGLSAVTATEVALRTVKAVERQKCRHCKSEETPQWRAGPEGPKTLCNACGVRYKSGRLVPEYRPASSPTFSALLHSNSHRRILKMRRMQSSGRGGGGV